MLKKLFKYYLYPVATLAGSIIGVGFLSLPYITLRVGVWPMLFYFIILTGLVIFINVIFGQIALKTPDHKRFSGFVKFYLGRRYEIITLISTVLGTFGVMLAYLIVGGQFLTNIMSPVFGGTASQYVFLYFMLGSLIIYFGVRIISKVEFWTLLLLLMAFGFIFITEFPHLHLGNLVMAQGSGLADWKTLFLPYGAIIFSLWGIGLIPEIEEMLPGHKQLLKRIIIIGTLIPALLYFLFIILVLGISGSQTTESALLGLQSFLGHGLFLVALFIGFLATFTAFITQGLFLKEALVYDVKMKEGIAWLFTCLPPLILFLLGFNSFIEIISFIGGVFLGINGIFILMMYRKIGGKKIIIYPLAVVFVLGILYEIVFFIK